MEKGRIFTCINTSIETWPNVHNLFKERIERQTIICEFSRIDKLKEILIHRTVLKSLAWIRSRRGVELLDEPKRRTGISMRS